MIHELFTPPSLVVPMSGVAIFWHIIGCLVLLFLLRITSAVLVRAEVNRGFIFGLHILWAYGLFALTLDFYRATQPGISWENQQWLWITGAYILAVTLMEWAVNFRNNNIEGALFFIPTTAISLIAAIIVDRMNEQIAVIPLSWGAILIIGLGVLIAASDRR